MNDNTRGGLLLVWQTNAKELDGMMVLLLVKLDVLPNSLAILFRMKSRDVGDACRRGLRPKMGQQSNDQNPRLHRVTPFNPLGGRQDNRTTAAARRIAANIAKLPELLRKS